jgi:hypothetical protein
MQRPIRLASRLASALWLAVATSATADPPPLSGGHSAWLIEHGRSPVEYVLETLTRHRFVILGERHWLRSDPLLVGALVPRLQTVGVTSLAMEVLPAARQEALNRLIDAPEWNEAAALAVLREAAWPYREYLEVIRAVWSTNRERRTGEAPLRLLALGPGADWRRTLAPGETYDSFMAARALDYLRSHGGRMVLYTGLNHAFTRHHQPELPRADRVEAFFDRMGNVLWRALGEDVALIVLHHPWRCRQGDDWTHCLPAGGAIDCAAARKSQPVGFDLAGSPFALLPLAPGELYGMGYPAVRLGDLADGWIWSSTVDQARAVSLIPLEEFAPDTEALVEVARHNPFSDEPNLGRDRLAALWESERDWLARFPRPSWEHLFGWRAACGPGTAAVDSPRSWK